MSKKTEATWIIIQHSLAAGAIELPPTPGIETAKEVPLVANEIGMCLRIANLYSKEKVTKEGVKRLLLESGIAVASAGGGAYIAAKVGKVAVKELLNFIPIVGWTIKSVVGGSLTAGIGWAFLKFCESRFG